MPPYQEQFKRGQRVTIAPLAELARFRRTWRWHHPLAPQQLRFAGQTAVVSDVGFYHGGDVLYWLETIEGTWHEACLRPLTSELEPSKDNSAIAPESSAQQDAIEADRLTALIQRMRRGPMYRIGGILVFAGFLVAVMFGTAFLLGRLPFWMTLATMIGLLIFGGIGEAIGRSVAERGANDSEVSFSRALLWDAESDQPEHVVGWLKREPEFSRAWLARLAMHSSDEALADLANRLLSLSSTPSAALR